MKLPITELMTDCCPEQVALEADIDTDRVKQAVLARIRAEPRPYRRFRPSVLLAAAVLVTLLVGTAIASGRAILTWEVEDAREADRIVVYYDEEGKVTDATVVEMPDAQFAVSYEVSEPQYNVIEYKLNWLPYPAHDAWPRQVSTEGWLASDGDNIENDGYFTVPDHPYRQLDEMLYQITVQGMTDGGHIYYYNGAPTVVKEDRWQGWNRLEFTIDYTNSPSIGWGRPINYLILFDPETSVWVQIAGTMDFETYERIAENMEVRVTDRLHYIYSEQWQEWMEAQTTDRDVVGNAGFADLGRG